MRSRGSTLRPLALAAPLLFGPIACSLLVESTLSDKPKDPVGAGGSGGIGGAGGASTTSSTGGAGGAPCDGACSATETCCTDTCADLSTNAQHCGACGEACAGGEVCCPDGGCAACCATTDCPQDHVCTNHTCVLSCVDPAVPCGDACALLDTTTNHCGTCDNDCLAGHKCAGGVCTPGWATMNTNGAPSPRQRAAAAWTGSALFIWGGQNALGALDDGALYDPKVDAWKTVSMTNAPTPRIDAIAVSTGDRVLVWGGGPIAGNSSLISGKLYDPQADVWTDVLDAPIGRRQPVAVWTGSRVLIWGGISAGSPIGGGALYDPVADGWTSMSNANEPTARSDVAWVWSGKELLLFGGRPGGSGTSDEGFGFDPAVQAMGVWRKLSAVGLPTARYNSFAVWTGNRMLLYGGRDSANALEDAWNYDPVGDAWSAAATPNPQDKRSAPPGRSGWTGYTTKARALFAGGIDAAQKLKVDGLQYDPATDTWPEAIPAWDSTLDHEYGVGVWTGVELILWSGLDNGVLTAGGERYRP